MSHIQKKVEKLASGVYLLTSFFIDSEPMKWKLRTLSGEMVSLGLLLKDSFHTDEKQVILELRTVVQELISLLEVAKSAALISDANHALIHGELVKFLETIGLPQGLLMERDKAVLSSAFFKSGFEDVDRGETEVREINGYTNLQLKDEKQPGLLDVPKNDGSHGTVPAPDKGHTTVNQSDVHKSLKDYSPVTVKKNSRQSIIINLLKRKKEIMIKDVSPLISGCSEKTIQRELLAMVKAGILKKIGEKRWSRYTLA